MLLALVLLLAPSTHALSAAPKGFGAPAKQLPAFQLSERTSDLALMKWMRGEGGDVGGVAVADFETGLRGLVSTRAFKKGDTVAGCPSALALALADPEATVTPSAAEADATPAPTTGAPADGEYDAEVSAALSQLLSSEGGSDGPLAAAAAPSSTPAASEDVGEAIVAAGEKLLEWYLEGPQGAAFSQYLATLPQKEAQFSPTPDFWDDDALDALAFEPAIAKARARRARVTARAEALGKDAAALRFATWLAASRSFQLRMQAPAGGDDASGATTTKTVPVLCPVLDMINHAPEPNARMVVRDAEKDDATFAIVAEQKIPKGAQITLAYRDGAASSVDLLLDYGFVPNKPPAGADRQLLAKHRDELAALRAVPRKATLAELEEDGLDPNRREALKLRAALQLALDKLPAAAKP